MPPPPDSYLAPSSTLKRGVIGGPLGRWPGLRGARELVGRHLEGGVDHAERLQHALGQRLAQLLAGQHLDQAALDVDRDAVFPARRPA